MVTKDLCVLVSKDLCTRLKARLSLANKHLYVPENCNFSNGMKSDSVMIIIFQGTIIKDNY